jgi:hypothetical protein
MGLEQRMASRNHHSAVAPAILAPAEDLCLTFANTLSWRGSTAPTEALGGLPDLLEWLAETGQRPAPAWSEAASWSHNHPKRAARLFTEALALREAIFQCCSAVARGDAVPDEALDALNDALAAAPPRRCLVPVGGGYRSTPRAALRQRQMPVAVHRPQQGGYQALVRHGRLRQPRQGATALSEQPAGLMRSVRGEGADGPTRYDLPIP